MLGDCAIGDCAMVRFTAIAKAMRRKHGREIRLLSTCDSKSGIDGEDAIVGLRLVIKSRLQEISTKPARLKNIE